MFVVLWICDYSGLDLPQYVPNTSFRLYGMMMFAVLGLAFYFFQRKALKQNDRISAFSLAIISVAGALCALLLYQTVRWFLNLGSFSDFANDIILNSLIIALFSFLLALSISFELKKANQLVKHIPTILILLLIIFFKESLKHISW